MKGLNGLGRADVDSFAVYAVLLMLLCVCSFPWLAFFAIVRQPCMLIPYQLACVRCLFLQPSVLLVSHYPLRD